MSQLLIEAMQWSRLAHIDHVRPIDETDTECLEEIRLVLKKHNCLSRFGISLLHSHFDLADDEMLMETTDLAKREHWVRPVKKSDWEQNGKINAQTTVVSFSENGMTQYCGCYTVLGHHQGTHSK